MIRRAATICILAASTLFLAACGERPHPSAAFTVNGYAASVAVPEAYSTQLESAKIGINNTASRILFALDDTNPRSGINRINSIAGTARWPIPNDIFRVLDLAHHYARLSEGALDVTLAPIAELWGFSGGEAPDQPPSDEILVAALQGVGEKNIRLSGDGTIAFYSPITRIHLGNIGVGYALDLGVVALRRQGITNLLARLHQSVRALGVEQPGAPWKAALPDPFQPTQTLCRVALPSGSALAIAQLREESVEIAGRTYGRILDPATGRPAEGIAMAAVIGPSATMANCLAQALVVKGRNGAPRLLARFPRCEALLVPDRQPLEIVATEKFKALWASEPGREIHAALLPRADAESAPPLPADDEDPLPPTELGL